MKTKFNGILTLLLALVVQISFAQDKTISGTVSDESGPLPGVTVLKKGTTQGTETDFDGNYSIKAKTGDVLVFSFVGMKSSERTVGTSNQINVTLTGDNLLEEVVVTALGVKRDKKSLGYATSKVGKEALEAVSAGNTNITNALTGQVTGINIVSGSGDVGSPTSIIIRGASSLSQSNQALFVVDGIPIDNSSLTAAGLNNGANRAADIDMNNVENVSVLKGGAATALYGERGANGVVLITTKKGKNNGKLNIEINQQFTFSEVSKLPQFQTKYGRGRNGGYINVTHWSWGAPYSENPVFPAGTMADLNGTGTREDVGGQLIPYYADNYANFFQTGTNNTTSVSVSGGSDKGNFYVGYGRVDQEGIVRNSELNRNSLTFNASQNITDKFTVGASVNVVRTETTKADPNDWGLGLVYYHSMWDLVNRPWKDATGDKTWFSQTVPDPMWSVNEENEYGQVNRTFGNVNLNYSFSEWFNVAYKYGIDTYSDNRERIRPLYSARSTGDGLGDMYEQQANVLDTTSDFIISGSGSLSEDFKLNYLVGNNIFESQYDRLYSEGREQILPDFVNLENFKTVTADAYKSDYRLIGVYADVTLNFKDYLFLGLTARNDWSSTLPSNNNSYFYPSANLGFILSEVMESDFINYAKLRTSVAQTGKSANPYNITDVYVKGGDNILNQPRFTVSDIKRNPDLKPEISTEWEIGGEFSFWGNRINLDATYYDKLSKDQFLRVDTSPTTGFSSKVINGGDIRNKGIEIALNLKNLVDLGELKWDVGFNFSKNTNTVESLADGFTDQLLIADYGAQKVAKVGKSTGLLVGTGYKRNANGDILVTDAGLPQLVSGLELGDTNPDWTLGITPSFKYKNFKLAALFDIKKGGDIFNGSEASWVYSGLAKSTENRFYPGSATANATTVIPGIIESTGQTNDIAIPLDNNYYQTYKDWSNAEELIEDASWVRLRNVTLSYDLPNVVLEKVGFTKAQISFTGTNLWLDTNFRGADPEASALGAGNSTGFIDIITPGTKSYSLGLKLGF